MNLRLSIIFPIFNEEKRIDNTFDQIKKFSTENEKFDLEFLFVNDGSNDKSEIKIKNFIKLNNNLNSKYIKSSKNMGKGNALKLGVEQASMDWILTTDVDLSVPLEQVDNWFKNFKLENSSKIVFFGSRNLDESIVEKKFYRYILGIIFSFLIKILFNINIKDSQCGFKLYTKKIAKEIFSKLETLGFAHDIELIQKLNNKKIDIKELPVTWKHISQSKLNIFTDSIRMIIDILRIYRKFK